MRIIPTTRALVLASALLASASVALAQGNAPAEIKQPGPPRVTAPGVGGEPVVKPGGVDNGGPGSIGTIAPGATGASSVSNNSGASGNAEQNQKPIGNTGGGGGGGS
jgi:hypothetical protein